MALNLAAGYAEVSWDNGINTRRIIDYVNARKCNSGGYCFYRLDEPNASDTFYAISILHTLGASESLNNTPGTVDYLLGLQKPDGTYDSVFVAYYAIKALDLLGLRPEVSPERYIIEGIERWLKKPEAKAPPEVMSIFKKLYFLVDLTRTLSIVLPEDMVDRIMDFIMGFKKENGGFGAARATIIETAHALHIMWVLGRNTAIHDTIRFISLCEHPFYGYVNTSDSSNAYIEHIYYGLMASHICGQRPKYIEQCVRFIESCMNANGGFARNIAGASNLENTYYAVTALDMISRWYGLTSSKK